MELETCDILKGPEVHEKLLEGSQDIAKAVATTFGPYGKNVTITMTYNVPYVTKDGATVARHIKLKDPVKNVAAQIINQAASKTAEVAGDGTTSTTILANSLVEMAFKAIERGKQPIEIRNAIKECEQEFLLNLKQISQETTLEDILSIAMVACNGDKDIAEIVTNAFKIIGENGIVAVSDSRSYETTLDTTEGIKLDRSHIISALINNKAVTKHKDCAIAITNMDINSELEGLKMVLLQEEIKKPLLIICNDLTGEAAKVISYNKVQRNVPIEVIRAPFIAEARQEALRDLCIVTGAFFINKEDGFKVTELKDSHLGSCESLEITLKETNIIGRRGKPEEIEERIKFYQEKIKEDKEGLKENYKKRLAYFNSGAAVIYVGGANESEVQEKKDRLDDTIRAVRSALAEGYVPGGAQTYLRIKEMSEKELSTDNLYKAICNCLRSLFDQLLSNSNGVITKESHFEAIRKGNIIDPTLVIKSTIQNAIGAAIMIFMTDCVIVKEGKDGIS